METNIWETTAQRLLLALRILFVTQLTWEFFLTIVFKTSVRSHVLMGAIAPFAPFIVVIWLIVIVGLTALVSEGVYRTTAIEPTLKRQYIAYTLIGVTTLLYTVLTILAIVNPLTAWPVALSFGMDIMWSVAMFYFRYKFQRIYNKKADMVELVDTQA